MTDTVLIERKGAIATVILNRPDKLNALNRPMWTGLGESMRALSEEDDLRAVVVRGAGHEAFCPGHDIDEFETELGTHDAAVEYGYLMRDTVVALRDCRHPTVALIEGICVGGGLELALACDLRISGTSGRFGLPISRIGVALAYPFMEMLVETVGSPTALEILLEARVFDAAEAKDKGLVTRVVADGEVETEAYAAAKRIAGGAPLANRWNKKFARRLAQPVPLSDEEFRESLAWADTDDFRAGYRAFLEKKKPVFEGR